MSSQHHARTSLSAVKAFLKSQALSEGLMSPSLMTLSLLLVSGVWILGLHVCELGAKCQTMSWLPEATA